MIELAGNDQHMGLAVCNVGKGAPHKHACTNGRQVLGRLMVEAFKSIHQVMCPMHGRLQYKMSLFLDGEQIGSRVGH